MSYIVAASKRSAESLVYWTTSTCPQVVERVRIPSRSQKHLPGVCEKMSYCPTFWYNLMFTLLSERENRSITH